MDDQAQNNGHQGAQDGLDDRRFKRLADYQQKAIKTADPLVATLAVINSDLMGMAFRLSKAIDGAVGEGAAGLQELRQVDPALNSYLRVAKQIDRFTQLAIHLGKSDRVVFAASTSPKKSTNAQAKKSRSDTHSRASAKPARRRK